jgi:hypothetical protein
MQKLHDLIKGQLHNSSQKYKSRIDQKRREVNFEIGDQVLAHLRKEIFLKGKYNKLKMKKIGPCKILRKFATNAYEIELSRGHWNIANIQCSRLIPLQDG